MSIGDMEHRMVLVACMWDDIAVSVNWFGSYLECDSSGPGCIVSTTTFTATLQVATRFHAPADDLDNHEQSDETCADQQIAFTDRLGQQHVRRQIRVHGLVDLLHGLQFIGAWLHPMFGIASSMSRSSCGSVRWHW